MIKQKVSELIRLSAVLRLPAVVVLNNGSKMAGEEIVLMFLRIILDFDIVQQS